MELKRNVLLIFLLLSGAMICCDEIVETDITGEQVFLVAPADSAVTEFHNITFYWEWVPGASHYLFQLAAPSFEQPETFLEDTLVAGNSISLALDSGAYAWRVSAENGSYFTDFSMARFQIVGTKDLDKYKVELLSPQNNAYTNDTIILFRWQPIIVADKYLLEVNNGELAEVILRETEYKLKIEKADADIAWKVSAINDNSIQTSETFSLSADFTPPSAPSLTGPPSDTVFMHFPVRLRWTRSEEKILRDSLFIFDEEEQLVSGFPKATEEIVYSLSESDLPGGGAYTWAVKSVDRAGNSGGLSGERKFTFQ